MGDASCDVCVRVIRALYNLSAASQCLLRLKENTACEIMPKSAVREERKIRMLSQ